MLFAISATLSTSATIWSPGSSGCEGPQARISAGDRQQRGALGRHKILISNLKGMIDFDLARGNVVAQALHYLLPEFVEGHLRLRPRVLDPAKGVVPCDVSLMPLRVS